MRQINRWRVITYWLLLIGNLAWLAYLGIPDLPTRYFLGVLTWGRLAAFWSLFTLKKADLLERLVLWLGLVFIIIIVIQTLAFVFERPLESYVYDIDIVVTGALVVL